MRQHGAPAAARVVVRPCPVQRHYTQQHTPSSRRRHIAHYKAGGAAAEGQQQQATKSAAPAIPAPQDMQASVMLVPKAGAEERLAQAAGASAAGNSSPVAGFLVKCKLACERGCACACLRCPCACAARSDTVRCRCATWLSRRGPLLPTAARRRASAVRQRPGQAAPQHDPGGRQVRLHERFGDCGCVLDGWMPAGPCRPLCVPDACRCLCPAAGVACRPAALLK